MPFQLPKFFHILLVASLLGGCQSVQRIDSQLRFTSFEDSTSHYMSLGSLVKRGLERDTVIGSGTVIAVENTGALGLTAKSVLEQCTASEWSKGDCFFRLETPGKESVTFNVDIFASPNQGIEDQLGVFRIAVKKVRPLPLKLVGIKKETRPFVSQVFGFSNRNVAELKKGVPPSRQRAIGASWAKDDGRALGYDFQGTQINFGTIVGGPVLVAVPSGPNQSIEWRVAGIVVSSEQFPIAVSSVGELDVWKSALPVAPLWSKIDLVHDLEPLRVPLLEIVRFETRHAESDVHEFRLALLKDHFDLKQLLVNGMSVAKFESVAITEQPSEMWIEFVVRGQTLFQNAGDEIIIEYRYDSNNVLVNRCRKPLREDQNLQTATLLCLQQ